MNCPHCDKKIEFVGNLLMKNSDARLVKQFLSIPREAQQLIFKLVKRLRN